MTTPASQIVKYAGTSLLAHAGPVVKKAAKSALQEASSSLQQHLCNQIVDFSQAKLASLARDFAAKCGRTNSSSGPGMGELLKNAAKEALPGPLGYYVTEPEDEPEESVHHEPGLHHGAPAPKSSPEESVHHHPGLQHDESMSTTDLLGAHRQKVHEMREITKLQKEMEELKILAKLQKDTYAAILQYM